MPERETSGVTWAEGKQILVGWNYFCGETSWIRLIFQLSTSGMLKLIAAPPTEIKETVMAKVIEFYTPKNFRKPLNRTLQLQRGKVIEFCMHTKKSA